MFLLVNTKKQDDTRDPLQRGYSRVETAEGSLSNSSTSTSLDTIVIESANEFGPLPPSKQLARTFSPILESDDPGTQRSLENIKTSLKKIDPTQVSKTSLKGSKVSFEQPDNLSSDEDSFEERREHFQQKKALSTAATDHKGILKVCVCVFVFLGGKCKCTSSMQSICWANGFYLFIYLFVEAYVLH